MSKQDIYQGAFNFDAILRDFYSDKDKSDEQKIMKSAFQGNTAAKCLGKRQHEGCC